MNNLHTLKWQIYPVPGKLRIIKPKQAYINQHKRRAKILLFIISITFAFLFGKLFIRALDSGNIVRCKNYRQTIADNPKVFVIVNVQTVEMCAKSGVNLK